MGLKISDAFGYHTDLQIAEKIESLTQSMSPCSEGDFNRSDVIEASPYIKNYKNLITIAGYIPIIGTIVGIAKLVFIGYWEEQEQWLVHQNDFKGDENEYSELSKRFSLFREGLKIRSWIEATSLGFLLLIPDLIMTHQRNIASAQQNAQDNRKAVIL